MADGPGEMLAAAEHAGIGTFAFCEHVFHFVEARESLVRMDVWPPEGPPQRVDDYFARIREAARRFPGDVRIGVEVDWYGDEPYESQAAAFVDEHASEWDLVLG